MIREIIIRTYYKDNSAVREEWRKLINAGKKSMNAGTYAMNAKRIYS
jgi:hypothetical protein